MPTLCVKCQHIATKRLRGAEKEHGEEKMTGKTLECGLEK